MGHALQVLLDPEAQFLKALTASVSIEVPIHDSTTAKKATLL